MPSSRHRGLACGTMHPELIVKNTFIDESSPSAHSDRRCASLPPSLRLTEGRDTKILSERYGDWEVSTDAQTEASEEEIAWSSDAESLSVAAVHTSASQAVSMQRAALSSKARAWVPGAPVEVSPACKFRQEATDVVFSMKARVQCSGVQVNAEAVFEGCGWTVTVTVKPQDSWCNEQLLTLAKEALLVAAEQSTCVYVLGHKASAFSASSSCLGFSGTLGFMEDESKACWDLYCNGSCARGAQCRWQHPSYTWSVNMVIFVGDPDV